MSSILRLIFLFTAATCAAPAAADALFRCVGKDGVVAFTSNRAGHSQCKLIGRFPAPAKPVEDTPASAAPAAAGERRVEFRTAPEGSEPKPVPVPEGAKPKIRRGAVYKYVKNGVTHYTNRPPAGQRAQVLFSYIEACFACSASSAVDFAAVALNLEAYAAEIARLADLHQVDPALVRAVIHAESAFNPNAVSRVGAQGLMQLMPATAARFGVTSAFEPAENIRGGVSYLAWLLDRYKGDTTRVAAAYNAGEGAVDKYGGVPPYEETSRFVERVGILHQRYREALASAASAPTAEGVAPSAASGVAN